MNLSIVIPNYNGEELLKKNLPKVLQVCSGAEIILVDDASTDGSVRMVTKEFPKVHLIAKRTNEGFASTVNVGVAAAKNEFVLLLNSDAYPKVGFMNTVQSSFEDPQLFAVGLAQECNEEGKKIIRGRGLGTFNRGFLFHRYAQPNAPATLWVSGGAGVFRTSVWRKLGGMQEAYNPFYWEDIDLSYRAMKAGYRIVFEPGAHTVHQQSIGSIRSSYSAGRIKTISYRNQIFFIWLNIADKTYLFQHAVWLPVHILKAFISGDWAFLRGFIDALFHVSRIRKERSKNKKQWLKRDNDVLMVKYLP